MVIVRQEIEKIKRQIAAIAEAAEVDLDALESEESEEEVVDDGQG